MDHATLTPDVDPHETITVPRVTVAVLDGRYSGALAYALKSALTRPATITVVHAEDDQPVPPAVPVEMLTLDGPLAASLVEATRDSDALVVEVPDDVTARLVDPRLRQLRHQVACLLIEVDGQGQVVRASGPVSGLLSEESIRPRLRPPVVVAGVDGSQAGLAVVDWACVEARTRGAVLRLVAVHAPEAPRADAEAALQRGCERTAGVTVEGVVVQGQPVDALVTQSHGAELLVVGSHRTSGLIHSALGGVGDSCARLADCPVVIVPSIGAVDPTQAGTDQMIRVPPSGA